MSTALGWILAALALAAAATPSAAGAEAGDAALAAPGAVQVSVSGDGAAIAFVTELPSMWISTTTPAPTCTWPRVTGTRPLSG